VRRTMADALSVVAFRMVVGRSLRERAGAGGVRVAMLEASGGI